MATAFTLCHSLPQVPRYLLSRRAHALGPCTPYLHRDERVQGSRLALFMHLTITPNRDISSFSFSLPSGILPPGPTQSQRNRFRRLPYFGTIAR